MTRILFFVFLAFLVWLAIRVLGARRSRDDDAPARSAALPAEPILQCAWCGVHVPAGAASTVPDGRVYCGPAHRDAAQGSS